MNRRISLCLLIAVMQALTVFSQDSSSTLPDPEGDRSFVFDLEQIFSEAQEVDLDEIIGQHEKETTNEIAIVTITSYEPYKSLYDFSLAIANKWGVGKKDKNNGVMVVFGKEIREIRIQVGYGLEKKLTDEEAKHIIDNVIIPEFRNNDFYKGIKDGLYAIIKEIK